jgi:acetyl esterase/lipase
MVPRRKTMLFKQTMLAVTVTGLMAMPIHAEVVSVKVSPDMTLATLQTDITYTDIANGFSRSHLKMDIMKPLSRTPTPVILFVSGNGWRSIDRAALIPQLAPFAKSGYLVASIDYRIIGEAIFPEPLKDVKSAVRFLRANAKKYNIDPERIGIWGNSAGGQLSALAATTADNKDFENDKWPGQSSAVQAAVVWYAPMDLADLTGDPAYVESAHLGVDVKAPANAEAVRKANPITYVTAASAPFMIVHGTEDKVVPIRHGENLHEALTKAKVPATLIKVEGAAHSFGMVSSTPEVMSRILAFFDSHLKKK